MAGHQSSSSFRLCRRQPQRHESGAINFSVGQVLQQDKKAIREQPDLLQSVSHFSPLQFEFKFERQVPALARVE